MNRKEWKEQSTVTIPLEYYEWLLDREKTLNEILTKIHNCFDFDLDNEAQNPTVNVDRLVEVALETTDEWFDSVVEFKDITYTNVDLQKVDKLRRLSENARRLVEEESKNMSCLAEEEAKRLNITHRLADDKPPVLKRIYDPNR